MASLESLGKGMPFVELDGIPYPLVKDSFIQVSPLAPFSTSLQSGASSRVADSRLSVEVWSDFSGGIGQLNEDAAETTSIDDSELDLRFPNKAMLPPKLNLGYDTSITSGTSQAWWRVEYLYEAYPSAALGYFLWNPLENFAKGYAPTPYTRTTGYTNGFTFWNGKYYYITYDAGGGGGNTLYSSDDNGATWSTTYTDALGQPFKHLLVWDEKLVTWNSTTGEVNVSLNGTSWAVDSTIPTQYGDVIDLFVWNDKDANKTLFAQTEHGIIWYEITATEWHMFYKTHGVFKNAAGATGVWRRDDNLYFSPNNGFGGYGPTVLMLASGGTSDNVSLNERFGMTFATPGYVYAFGSSVHWLYAFVSGADGGIYALNANQGWSQVFDPVKTFYAGSTTALIGGGYANSKLFALTDDGRLWSMEVPDYPYTLPALGLHSDLTGEVYRIRSSWTGHNQWNRWKIASHFEIDFRNPDGGRGPDDDLSFVLRYQVDNDPWVSINASVLANSGPARVYLPDGVALSPTVAYDPNGVPYQRLRWELEFTGGYAGDYGSFNLASVALYYAYWQGNFYAYQFNVDLSNGEWLDVWPDMTFGREDGSGYYTRDELVAALLGMNQSRHFKTFKYASGSAELYIPRVDMLVASREEPEIGGGIYSVTVRDLSGDGEFFN